EATLHRHERAIEEPAAAIATVVRPLLPANIGVSITGVSGPDAEAVKPVGLTFIGIAAPTLPSSRGRGESVLTHRFQWTGDRWDNRRRSVIAALELLVQTLGS